MKKFFLFTTMLMLAFSIAAQDYDAVKNLLILNQYKKAKEDFDKAMTNPKYSSKAEAYLLKMTIYSGLAMDKTVQPNPDQAQLTKDALEAYKKYKEMQPDLKLVTDPIYQNGPVNLYASLYGMGYEDYQSKKWEEAHEKFINAVEMSDLLINQKLFKTSIDTNVLILAGVTSENSKHDDDAAKYYSRLADQKVGGEDMENIYRFMVRHSFMKGDMAAFEKYKAIGKELYPKSEFFNYDSVDFGVGLAADFETKVKELEKVLATKPDDFKANQTLGIILYDTLNPRDPKGVPPANADELEKKMIDALSKASAVKPETEIPYIYQGDHYIGKAIKTNEAKEAFVKEMKGRTKAGAQPAKDDVQKRDAFDVQYSAMLDHAREPYEKAAGIFAGKSNLSIADKQQYKKVVSYLADIYANKKTTAKGKPADQAKYAAEEKKWNEVYESIKMK